jgi:hypothetical protein
MANGPYAFTRRSFLTDEIDYEGGDFILIGVGAGYTYSIEHEVIDDLTDVLDTDVMAQTLVDEWFDADDNSLTVATGDTLRGLVIAQNTGDNATSKLVLFMDTNFLNNTAINRPGNDNAFPVRWPAGGIFRTR